MLTFTQQQKIVNQLLKRSTNQQCADCNTISPTWASLDFGVFLCSNCSGAHRALGPTITRVRSTKLDKWENQWFSNMQIGNKQLNQFWEYKVTALTKKPNLGSSLDQVNRYVNDKYIKRKYAAQGDHPLKLYKQNKYNPQSNKKLKVQNALQQQSKTQQTKQSSKLVNNIFDKKKSNNLLEFQEQSIEVNSINKVRSQNQLNKIIEENDQFGEFTSANNNEKEMTFEQLMNKQKNKTTHQNNQNLNKNINNIHDNNLHVKRQPINFNSYSVMMQEHMHNNYNNSHNYNHYQNHINNLHHNQNNRNNFYNSYGNMGNNYNLNHNNNINTFKNQNNNMINHHNNQNNFNYNSNFNANNNQNHNNFKNNGQYHSLQYFNNNLNNINQQQSQQGNYPWLNHQHHYHHQNTTGLDGHLPVNAKFPGQFTPISLHVTHSQDKKEIVGQSWTDSWK